MRIIRDVRAREGQIIQAPVNFVSFRVTYLPQEVYWPLLSKLIQTVRRFGWLPSNWNQRMTSTNVQDDFYREHETMRQQHECL